MWLKTISKRTIRLRSGVRFEINATPHSFSLSSRLLQVTVAISPPAAKGASKGRFSARIRSEGPRSQMQDFETRTRGELRRRNRKFYQTEGDADFREKVSRSIWHSELRLSTCDRILPARRILSFGGDSRLVVCFCWLGKGSLLPEKHPFRCVCKRCICWGIFRLEETRKQRSAFSYHLSARGHGWLRRLRNEAWKNLKSASTR